MQGTKQKQSGLDLYFQLRKEQEQLLQQQSLQTQQQNQHHRQHQQQQQQHKVQGKDCQQQEKESEQQQQQQQGVEPEQSFIAGQKEEPEVSCPVQAPCSIDSLGEAMPCVDPAFLAVQLEHLMVLKTMFPDEVRLLNLEDASLYELQGCGAEDLLSQCPDVASFDFEFQVTDCAPPSPLYEVRVPRRYPDMLPSVILKQWPRHFDAQMFMVKLSSALQGAWDERQQEDDLNLLQIFATCVQNEQADHVMPGADFGQPLGHKPIVINPVPYLLDPLCSPSPLNTTSNEPLQQQTANEGLHAKESSTARITSVKGSVPTKSVQGSAAYKFAQGGAGAKSTKSKAKGLKDPAAPAAVVNMPVSDVHAEDDDSVIQQQMEEAQRQFKKGPKAPLPLQSGAQEVCLLCTGSCIHTAMVEHCVRHAQVGHTV